MLSSTAASGANASVSSSWNEETSQTTVDVGLERCPTSPLSASPTLPATATGRPASRWMWPIQLDRRRLAVRAGHGDELVGEQPPGELELAEHRQPRRARRGDHGRLRRDAGALDDGSHAASSCARPSLPGAARRPAPRASARRAARRDRPRRPRCSARAQRQRRGDSRAGEPDDQVRTRRERRSRLHPRCALRRCSAGRSRSRSRSRSRR